MAPVRSALLAALKPLISVVQTYEGGGTCKPLEPRSKVATVSKMGAYQRVHRFSQIHSFSISDYALAVSKSSSKSFQPVREPCVLTISLIDFSTTAIVSE